jgi:hypothetical protein
VVIDLDLVDGILTIMVVLLICAKDAMQSC